MLVRKARSQAFILIMKKGTQSGFGGRGEHYFAEGTWDVDTNIITFDVDWKLNLDYNFLLLVLCEISFYCNVRCCVVFSFS
jgi:hypothetical protein